MPLPAGLDADAGEVPVRSAGSAGAHALDGAAVGEEAAGRLAEAERRRDECEQRLRANLSAKAGGLGDLLKSVNDMWGYEDPIYRFYHQSFKVFHVQAETQRIVVAL